MQLSMNNMGQRPVRLVCDGKGMGWEENSRGCCALAPDRQPAPYETRDKQNSNFSPRRWPPHFFSLLHPSIVSTWACLLASQEAESNSDAAVAAAFRVSRCVRDCLLLLRTLQGPARRVGPRRTTS